MKQKTIDRIIENHDMHKETHIGKYTYKLQWHPMAGKTYIVRCLRGYETCEYIAHDGTRYNCWYWLMPI